ncbi:MAG: glycine cleavage system protein GcvH [Actinomycetota bacterium]
MDFPADLRYTKEHEWVREEGALLRVGISDFAQDALGDVVYVDLPDVGSTVTAGRPMGEVESTKSVSDVYSPVSGTVKERNPAVDARPELVNESPYGEGWLVVIEPADAGASAALLDAEGYETHVRESERT